MSGDQIKSGTVYSRAWEIISKDDAISPEEKKAILKLIQVLIEARDHAKERVGDGEEKTITQEVISKHSLMMTVKHQADELDALKRISLNLISNFDLKKVLEVVVSEAMGLIKDSYAAHIFLYENEVLEFGASVNAKGERNIAFSSNSSSVRPHGLTYSVALSGNQIIIEDMSKHPLYQDVQGKWDNINGSIVGVPLKFKDQVIGVMNVSRKVAGRFSRSELRLISLLADQAAVAIFNANLYKQIAQMANTDPVTGLPNRRALDERLQAEWQVANQTATPFAVVMMDMDGFKAVNDTFGHKVGDDLLNSLFNYLAKRMRTTDFLARYGGDELTLVMRNTDLKAAQVVTEKVIDLMKEYKFPFPQGQNIRLGLTAGIAAYPIHANNPSDLIRAADSALYHAKKYHRGRYAMAKGITGKLNSIHIHED